MTVVNITVAKYKTHETNEEKLQCPDFVCLSNWEFLFINLETSCLSQ